MFWRNRLNVAVSRAKCLAYIVASPRLLETSCRTVEQMRLVNALCRLVELGTHAIPESEYVYDFSFPEEGGKPNPHLWTNPPMARNYARLVTDTLVRRDPASATTGSARARTSGVERSCLSLSVRNGARPGKFQKGQERKQPGGKPGWSSSSPRTRR